MPTDPTEVHVTGDPLVVTIFVALFAGAMVLAVVFVLLGRIRGTAQLADGDHGEARASTDSIAGAKPPWSTAEADEGQPWSDHGSKPPPD